MSTSYSWEATLLGALYVPEHLCGGYVYLGRYIKCSTFTFTFTDDLSKLTLCIMQHAKVINMFICTHLFLIVF